MVNRGYLTDFKAWHEDRVVWLRICYEGRIPSTQVLQIRDILVAYPVSRQIENSEKEEKEPLLARCGRVEHEGLVHAIRVLGDVMKPDDGDVGVAGARGDALEQF